MRDRPIGMFDSGFGGLTVARATIDLLPSEDLIYLGDTGRYPYGPRPLDEVRRFSLEIAKFLLDRYDVKVLVVACNTATAAALDDLVAELPIPVLGVIDPGVQAVVEASESGRFGVIGTIGTVGSGAYEQAVDRIAPESSAVVCACPGFVEFVERGITVGPEIETLAARLLAPIVDVGIDALLLGCTHYPYLNRVISDVVGRDVVLVSSADETAFALARLLVDLDINRPDINRPDSNQSDVDQTDVGQTGKGRVGSHRFISSGDVTAFTKLGSRLLGPELIGAELWRP